MGLKERLEKEGVEVEGTFDVQRFFDTLAKILSNKMHMQIEVTVVKKEEQQKEKVG